jgi:hypothetical protein
MTAVEWLYNNLKSHFEHDGDLLEVVQFSFEQAKEMQKQQIIDARQDGYECTYAEYGETPKCYLDGNNEQYYNETFKNK